VSRPLVGDRLELRVEGQAHGGHAVARYGETGLVVFVRHAVPDEVVVAEVTEDDGRFLRADAVTVLEASPDRVVPPCPYAGPGACGGCDLQHVTPGRQRALKADVVREQLQRLAGLEVDVTVEPVGEPLRWRSRMRYVALPEGQRGLRVHRSHDVVAVDDCRIEAPGAVVTVEGVPPGGPVVETVETVHGTRTFRVAGDGFWQPHVDAPRVLVETVLELARPREGERVLDLYAGVGLFSAYLAQAVGPAGSVVAVEGDRTAAGHADHNLADLGVRMVRDRVDRALHRGLGDADLVVLDPPRVGAKRQVVRHLAALGPRAVVYVACDPAALARDLGYFAEQGYRLETLRAFDLFPMTSHVEVVALLAKGS
jgi:tRNA/tmRNA/rRNA uracil-C5-methylase (TrmA/RlmC/RlmD family)